MEVPHPSPTGLLPPSQGDTAPLPPPVVFSSSPTPPPLHVAIDMAPDHQTLELAPPQAIKTSSSQIHVSEPSPPILGRYSAATSNSKVSSFSSPLLSSVTTAPKEVPPLTYHSVFLGHNHTAGGIGSSSLLGHPRVSPPVAAVVPAPAPFSPALLSSAATIPAPTGVSTGNGSKPSMEVLPWGASPVLSPPVAAIANPRREDPWPRRAPLSHRRPTPSWPPSAPRGRGAAHTHSDDNIAEESGGLGGGMRRRQDNAYHTLGLQGEARQPGGFAAATRRVLAGLGGGSGRQLPGGGGGGGGGAPQAPNQPKWYKNSGVLFIFVVLFYLLYHGLLCGVSLLISVLPEATQKKRGNWIWFMFWLIVIPFVCMLYMKLSQFAAEVKEMRMAANQANAQQREDEALYRVKAGAFMIWVNAIARVVYLVVGNSWPKVAIAHGVGFLVEIAEVLVKYKVEGEINIGLPQV